MPEPNTPVETVLLAAWEVVATFFVDDFAALTAGQRLTSLQRARFAALQQAIEILEPLLWAEDADV